MLTLARRNVTLYLRNRTAAFFSLINALIGFVLYLLFLKDTMASNWTGGSQGLSQGTINNLLDSWLIGGILASTAVTTALILVAQMVRDRENGLDVDFLMALHSRWRIACGYLLSSTVITFAMQLVVLVIIGGYFTLTDGITLPWRDVRTDVLFLAVMLLAAALSSLLCYAFNAGIRTQSAASGLTSFLGTAAGFLSCVYFPIGVMPKAAQHVVQFWPGAYCASLMRRLLMPDAVSDAFSGTPHASDMEQAFRAKMGIGYSLPGMSGDATTSATQDYAIHCALTFALVMVWMSVNGWAFILTKELPLFLGAFVGIYALVWIINIVYAKLTARSMNQRLRQ